MCINKNSFAKAPPAKQKHAEFMMKMAEIIYGIVLTGLLGTSVLVWFSSKDVQTNGSFGYFMALSIAGIFGGCYLQHQAMAIFNLIADNTQGNASMPIAVPPDRRGPLAIQIQHGNTHISINIQPEKNNAQ